MGTDDTIDDVLLARYLAGGTSTEDEEQLARWLAADPRHVATMDHARRLWEARAPRTEYDTSTAWAVLGRDIKAVRSPRVQAADRWVRGQGRSIRHPWLGTSAIMGVAAAVIVAALVFRHPESGERFGAQEYVTSPGQRGMVTLVDGTVVHLAPNSRVHISQGYGRVGAPRSVTLEGEAVFAVVHDATRPFTIYAKHMIARDIGTRFDVQAYPEDSLVRVVVAEGAVAIAKVYHGTPVIVAGGHEALFSDQHGVQVRDRASPEEDLAWSQGELVFREMPLSDVARVLQRWYGRPVVIADTALSNRPLTAKFDEQRSLDLVMSDIARAVSAHVVWSGSTVMLKAGNHS